MKNELIKQLKQCTSQDEVDQIIRANPVIFVDDKELNNMAYNVRYNIEAKRIENIKIQEK
jgi:hypothetical protein